MILNRCSNSTRNVWPGKTGLISAATLPHAYRPLWQQPHCSCALAYCIITLVSENGQSYLLSPPRGSFPHQAGHAKIGTNRPQIPCNSKITNMCLLYCWISVLVSSKRQRATAWILQHQSVPLIFFTKYDRARKDFSEPYTGIENR